MMLFCSVSASAAPTKSLAGKKVDTVLVDARRERQVHLEVFIPRHPENNPRGKAPVWVVFSDLKGVSKQDRELAEKAQKTESIAVILADPVLDAKETLETRALWLRQAKDGVAVIDQLPKLERLDPVLRERVDFNRIGVVGRGLGAYTVLLFAGATLQDPGLHGVYAVTEPRAHFFAAIDAPELPHRGLYPVGLAALYKPVLWMLGKAPAYAAAQGLHTGSVTTEWPRLIRELSGQ